MHERIYTIKDEADVVEFTTWKVRAMGDTGGAGRKGRKLSPQQGTPRRSRAGRSIWARRDCRPCRSMKARKLGAGAKVRRPVR